MPTNTTDKAIRLQVLVERVKKSYGKTILRATRDFEDFALSVTSGDDLKAMTTLSLTRHLRNVRDRTVLSDDKAHTYIAAVRDFAETQAGIEAEAWDAMPLQKEDIDIAFAAPLSIDSGDRGKDVSTYVLDSWGLWQTNIMGAIRRAAFEKRDNQEIKDEIRGTKRLNFNDGLLNRIRRNAAGLNNVVIHHVVSSVRNVVLSTTDAKGILWNALFEKSVCQKCRGLDTQPFPIDAGPRSPVHIGCRCIMVPIFADTDVSEMKQSYYSWLKTQDPAFIEDALGATWAKVLLEGGMSVERFAALQLDRNFEPLTLAEFKLKAPSAFQKAGV